ncbi:nucleotidyltransferase family protein [Shivajiella indica]|uniref:Nucleotidyltransferase family protein n=1 Tax=Shivajiella indica TaxID=872115 RepID=A0ABW5B5K7_9BACT
MIPIEEIQQKYGVEMAVVVLACRVHFQTAEKGELQDFIDKNSINWDKVLDICYMHRIRMLVYRIFLIVNIPDTTQQYIKEDSLHLVQRNFKQALELERIVTSLEAEGIRTIPYKGLAFSKQFFGDIVSRESSDIDLIIRPEDLKRIDTLMIGQGYRGEFKEVLEYLGNNFQSRYKDYIMGKFLGEEHQFSVEFHWSIVEKLWLVDYQIIQEMLYRTKGKAKILKAEVDLLDPNSHFIFILLHHCIEDVFHSLREMIDLAQVASQSHVQVDWEYILNTLQNMRLSNAFLMANRLIWELFGLSLGGMREMASLEKADKFLGRILLAYPMNPHAPFDLGLHQKRLLLRDNFLYQVRSVVSMIQDRFRPSKQDIVNVKLPKGLFFIYGIIKPYRTFLDFFTKSK